MTGVALPKERVVDMNDDREIGRRRKAILGKSSKIADDDFSNIEERWVSGVML